MELGGGAATLVVVVTGAEVGETGWGEAGAATFLNLAEELVGEGEDEGVCVDEVSGAGVLYTGWGEPDGTEDEGTEESPASHSQS